MEKIGYNERVYFLDYNGFGKTKNVLSGVVCGREHLTVPRLNCSESTKNSDLFYIKVDRSSTDTLNGFQWVAESCVFLTKESAEQGVIDSYKEETKKIAEDREQCIKQKINELKILGYKITK